MKEAFLNTYNSCADDIFAYCYEETRHREISKYLTRNIFAATWDVIAYCGGAIGNIRKLLFRTARDQVKDFLSSRKNQVAFREKLWKLTLSQ